WPIVCGGSKIFDFHPTYLQRIEQMFDAPLAPLDFRGASDASRKTTRFVRHPTQVFVVCRHEDHPLRIGN
ncbi:MAG: hypothetical protein KDA99_25440, partial [Planctomycetales bacterium]|nr:hypothetical protein [Planctomycetales bacterium]